MHIQVERTAETLDQCDCAGMGSGFCVSPIKCKMKDLTPFPACIPCMNTVEKRLSPLDDTQAGKNCLALFDFDGTITNRDSMFVFLQYLAGWPRFLLGMICLSPILLGHKLGLVRAEPAKQALLHWFLTSYSNTELQQHARRFCATRLPTILRPTALNRIAEHQRLGHKVAIVSASAELWLEPWCKQQTLGLIATRLDLPAQRGKNILSGKNCSGAEKLARIESKLNTREFDLVFAFGDSRGDQEMLSIADYPYYRVFN